MAEYLTTKELAQLLRIKERKVYDLAASGSVPCSKAMGKLLFPRAGVDAWLAGRSDGFEPVSARVRPNVLLGSHDPLLDWALRESGSGLATYFDGSVDGLDRFVRREGVAAGLHLYDAGTDGWNTAIVSERCRDLPVVLVEWARRRRGLILGDGEAGSIRTVADLRGRRIVPRQAASGAQVLLLHLLGVAGVAESDIAFTAPARTEADAALAVAAGKADAALGLAALAAQYRLPFVDLVEERYDLLVDRRAWFEPPMQRFLEFCRSPLFRERAADHAGYEIGGIGTVHFNAP